MQILGEAIEREPESRDDWVDTVCAGDEVLRAEVARLLARQKPAAQFLEESLLAAAAGKQDPNGRSMIGQRVGLYKIISEIGRGGMGAVYLAERDDQQFTKRVAIKLIKRGMDTDFVVQRFRNERQILASLDHPNIARLLDGGATEGDLPYFVMEYVKGDPIIKYGDANNLNTTERLKLFRLVCSAVQYAHQNLIIHRDLKPSNVLVTKDGEPKLLDFGIAKLLQADGEAERPLTATAVRVMTPEYASPEQIKGERITTASDVYSLGVLLYELLTGTRPYRVKSRQPEEIARAICEQQPEKPSVAVSGQWSVVSGQSSGREQRGSSPTVKEGSVATAKSIIITPRSLRGDLDNIVLMALRKEPARRYASAEQFSEDIRRHLEGLPVIARKATLSYRTSKFVQRNKIGVAAAAIILMTLIAGIIGTAWQAHRARIESASAQQRFNEVRALAQELAYCYAAIGFLHVFNGPPEKAVDYLRKGLPIMEELSAADSNNEDLQYKLANVYIGLAKSLGIPPYPNLGDSKAAIEYLNKFQSVVERLASHDPANPAYQSMLAAGQNAFGLLFGSEGRQPEALESYKKSVAIEEEIVKRDPGNTFYRRELATNLKNVATAMSATGDKAGAIDYRKRSLAMYESMAAADPNDAVILRDEAVSYSLVGVELGTSNRAGALKNFQKALQIFGELVAKDPKNEEFRNRWANTYLLLSRFYSQAADLNGAVDSANQGIKIDEVLVAASPANATARNTLAQLYSQLGASHAAFAEKGRQMEHWRAARDGYQKSLDMYADMKSKGTLSGRDANKPDDLAKEIAKCDAALKVSN